MYKERLDSLLSYQKTLNDIVTTTKKEENKIRAIAALQSIESDIFNIFKQLPEVRIEQIEKEEKEPEEFVPDPEPEEVWGDGTETITVETTKAIQEQHVEVTSNRANSSKTSVNHGSTS